METKENKEMWKQEREGSIDIWREAAAQSFWSMEEASRCIHEKFLHWKILQYS